MNEFEKYFIKNFNVKNFDASVKIFDESMNCNRLSFTFKRDEIYLGCTINQNSDKTISLYGLYCNILGSKAKHRLSKKIKILIQQKDMIAILNKAINEEKTRIDRIHRQTQNQSLLNTKTLSEWCPYCEIQVNIKNDFKIQSCPNCGKQIKPCALCDFDLVNCEDCPL